MIVIFTFVGEHLLNLLHVGEQTILIAGGLILFMIALRMIFPKSKDAFAEGHEEGEPFIVSSCYSPSGRPIGLSSSDDLFPP